ncbi:MAG: serine acetyltransferase [Solirubrobacteraceae bacterium]|nr:serine acetyltransferase [Solirubrobacteraceae bacterium]
MTDQSAPQAREPVEQITSSERGFWAADRAVYHPGLAGWYHEPALWAVAVYRFGRFARTRRGPVGMGLRVAHAGLHLTMRVTLGIEIPATARFGPGLHVFHQSGIVVGRDVVVGARCRLRQGVTIGVGETRGPSPVLGDDVFLGPYAQVLGDVSIGDGAVIGPLAVVTRDVPAGGRVRAAAVRID